MILLIPLSGSRIGARGRQVGRQLLDRQRTQTELEQASEQNLIIVHCAKNHAAMGTGWFFNDASEIVWARDKGAESKLQFTKYFSNRTAWIVEPDAMPPVLRKVSPDSSVGPRSVTLQAGTLER